MYASYWNCVCESCFDPVVPCKLVEGCSKPSFVDHTFMVASAKANCSATPVKQRGTRTHLWGCTWQLTPPLRFFSCLSSKWHKCDGFESLSWGNDKGYWFLVTHALLKPETTMPPGACMSTASPPASTCVRLTCSEASFLDFIRHLGVELFILLQLGTPPASTSFAPGPAPSTPMPRSLAPTPPALPLNQVSDSPLGHCCGLGDVVLYRSHQT